MKEKYVSAVKKWFIEDSGNASGVVLGISGGKDSTVTLALLVEAIGKDRVLALLMPNGLDLHNKDYLDSVDICNHYNVKHITIDIRDTYKSVLSNHDISCVKITDDARYNLAPRLRMINLFTIGQSLNYRVAGTSNKSELTVGWFTKGGDNNSDINILADLTKTEVINLGKELNVPEKWLLKPPADGIRTGVDEDNFGFTYEELDKFILNNEKSDNHTKIQNRIKIATYKNRTRTISEYIN